MANFNLAWFDPLHIEQNPEIAALYNKQTGYTKEDRIKIIELQREIMRKIIPEITTATAAINIGLTIIGGRGMAVPLHIIIIPQQQKNKEVFQYG